MNSVERDELNKAIAERLFGWDVKRWDGPEDELPPFVRDPLTGVRTWVGEGEPYAETPEGDMSVPDYAGTWEGMGRVLDAMRELPLMSGVFMARQYDEGVYGPYWAFFCIDPAPAAFHKTWAKGRGETLAEAVARACLAALEGEAVDARGTAQAS